MPAGTTTARTSRFTTNGSLACERMALFRRDRRRLLFQRGVQRVPAESGALDPHGELAHARQCSELAELGGWRGVRLGEKAVHFTEEAADSGAIFALDGLRHHRSGRRRNGATATLEAYVFYALAIHAQEQGQAVAAQRVVALRLRIRRVQRAEIARLAVVIEDHVAVEILQLHQGNTSRTLWSAATSFSTSCT